MPTQSKLLNTHNRPPAFAGGAVVRASAKNSALTFLNKKLSGVFASSMLAAVCLSATFVEANTPANTLINNTAYVNFQFRGATQQVQGSTSFITARAQNGAGTPSVITLMHNSINFSQQLQAANNAASASRTNQTSNPQARSLNNSFSSFNGSPQGRNGASSSGQALSGSFPVVSGRCASDSSANTFNDQPTPVNYQGTTLSLPSSLSLNSDEYFKVGDTIFIHLEDLDQNLDPTAIEKINVTILSENGIDAETIELTETDLSTGQFTGYVQSVDINAVGATPYDCRLSVTNNSTMQASYMDQFDAVDVARAGALFDPNSYVVNADTGEYVNGIEVTLLNAADDSIASVLSDEGGLFPNPITTGAGATDSLGNVYSFPFGGFQFPVLASGQYKIQIGESVFHDYPIPAQRSLSDINALPNGPFNLEEDGSRAQPFDVNGITFRMDVPLDPKDNSVLLTKTANKSRAGLGELVRYNITMQNSEIPGDNFVIQDVLPQGFRYVEGSASLDGNLLTDPVISSDGRTLQFNIGNIAVDETLTLNYVTLIGVDTPLGDALNTATLEDDILVSNSAQAKVEIEEDLFANSTRLFGRVYIGQCDAGGDGDNSQEQSVPDEGLSGIRIYLEDGSYVVTDEDGLYHMEGIQPGTHVVQLDTDTLPKYLDLVACENLNKHAGRAYSQFVDLEKGAMWRSDFVVKLKPPAKGEVVQRLGSYISAMTEQELTENKQRNITSPVQQKLNYRLDLNGSDVILKGLRALVMLPPGVVYKDSSASFDGSSVAEPRKYDEQTLLFTLNDPGKNWQHLLEFEALITQDAKPGELTTRSVAMFNAPAQNNQRTPVALTSALLAIVPEDKQVHEPKEAPKFSSFSEEMNQQDKDAMKVVIDKLKGLEDIQIEVAGHTDNVPIARRSRHIFKNNQELSLARARSAANYLMAELKLEPHQVSITGYGQSKPIAQNSSKDSRAKNRRVEVKLLAGRNGMAVAQADSGNQMVATQGVAPGGFDFPVEATATGPIKNVVTMPEFDKAFLAQTNNKFEWLWPSKEYLPNIPSTKVAIKHPNDQRIELMLNEQPVSQLNFANRENYKPNQSAVSMWAGVDIKEGNNHFVASLIDSEGNIIDRIEYDLHYAGSPTRVELLPDESKTLADGVVTPVIAVKLFDKDGYPVRDGLQGEFSVDAPYLPLDPNKNKAQINRGDFKPNYEITSDGIAYISLEPTTQAGVAVLRFPLANGKQEEIRVWLKPQNREWMLIALGEGTVGLNDISGNISNAEGHGAKDDVYTDGRLALFAKGQILGDWLLTAAYDSEKGKTTPFQKLIQPNKYYTLYGDNSQQKLDASMEGKLYVRIEKERFYTVFGDYSTDMNKSELAKYLRKFHGIQSVFQGDIVSFNVFATESAQRFVRDEIAGDGTSGLYQLTNKDIISNSETISLQVKDRLRSEVILSEVDLVKDTDYTIDYLDGTIFFKTPVRSTDDQLNPRFIIARYETQDDSANDLTYGGRAAVHVLDDSLEVGTTIISEELGTNSKTLSAVDFTMELGEALEIKAETATTEQNNNGVKTEAQANYVSLDYNGERLQSKAYVRTEEAGFGLEQLSDSEESTEKLGIESTYYFTSQEYLNTLISNQNTLGSAARQTLVEVKYNQESQYGRYYFGVRANENQNDFADSQSIQQLLAGQSYTLFNGSLLVNADGEFNLTNNDNVYDILRLGSDYRINESITLYAIHEMGFESDAPQRSVAGLRTSPWDGMQVSNSVEQQASKDGVRLFAVHGLNQEVNINDHWQFSFGFDQSQDLENSINDNQTLVSSQDDFYATNVGWGYRSESWQWTNRIEYRESDLSNKWNAQTGLYRPVASGLALGVNVQYRLDEQDTSTTEFKQSEFDIGFRPLAYDLAWLNQTKLIEENQRTADSNLVSRRLVNNTHINQRFSNWQISAQYGFKYVDETIDGIDYSGFVDLVGTQMRYYINNKWDWGLHGQRLYDYEMGNSRHSAGISIGLSPKQNTWVSFGYNFAGFDDSDFDSAGYSAQGIYLKVRVKADQDSMRELRDYFN